VDVSYKMLNYAFTVYFLKTEKEDFVPSVEVAVDFTSDTTPE
jgi:hypothetical protein